MSLKTPAETAIQELIDALAEPSLVINQDMIVTANAAARSVLGSAIEGRDVRLAIRQPAAIECLTKALEDAVEVDLVGPGGADRHWLMSVTPLGDGAKFVRLLDRSAVHAAEQMRVDFVANASHELRTPLATIVGYSETLRETEGLDDKTRAHFAAIVHDEALRMQRVVEDLISLSRIEGERFNAPDETLTLTPLIDQTIASHQRMADEHSSAIDKRVEDDPEIRGDRSQLLQVIDNLLSNALRYGREATPVTVSLAHQGRFLRLSVGDCGEGIPGELIPRLTERFFRVDTGRSRALGGTGLGLAIVKHIVERHRGRLEIESEVGIGTTVSVFLPLSPVS